MVTCSVQKRKLHCWTDLDAHLDGRCTPDQRQKAIEAYPCIGFGSWVGALCAHMSRASTTTLLGTKSLLILCRALLPQLSACSTAKKSRRSCVCCVYVRISCLLRVFVIRPPAVLGIKLTMKLIAELASGTVIICYSEAPVNLLQHQSGCLGLRSCSLYGLSPPLVPMPKTLLSWTTQQSSWRDHSGQEAPYVMFAYLRRLIAVDWRWAVDCRSSSDSGELSRA